MEHIGNVMSQTTNGSELKKRSTPKRVCEFCGTELEPLHKAEIGTRVYEFGTKPCTCPEGQSQHEEQERVAREFREEQEQLERSRRINELFRNSMIPKRWETRTFEHFQVNKENQKAYELAKRYAENFNPSEGRGLIITGTVGTGKTHLVAAIAMYLLQREYSVVFGTVTNLLSQLRGTYGRDKVTEWDVMKRFQRCQLLIVDDIGKEKVTDWVEQTMYEIINARYEENRSIIITSNHNITDIRAMYPNVGDALVDRIIEMCHGAKLVGESWRKKAMFENQQPPVR